MLGTGPDGTLVEIDVDVLTETRALVQADSGFGKSWLVRRLLEESHGRVQHLVIDPEGDFVTLRERFDYLVVAGGGDGDLPADPKMARVLAAHLLEHDVSAVVDLSELTLAERRHYVDEFLQGLMQAPESAWHRVLVVIDEAHEFAPQQGSASSKVAVADLMRKGRKRGLGAVLVTQRLAALDKNAAAQASNRFVGHCSIETDRHRAGDDLGLGRRNHGLLSTLGVGEFCVRGPAISNEMRRVKVGDVYTSHGSWEGARQPVRQSPALAEVLPLLVEALRVHGGSAGQDQPDASTPTPSTSPNEGAERRTVRGRRAATRREAGPGPAAGASRPATSRTDGEYCPVVVREPVGTNVPSSDGAVRASIDEYSGDVEITIRIAHLRR